MPNMIKDGAFSKMETTGESRGTFRLLNSTHVEIEKQSGITGQVALLWRVPTITQGQTFRANVLAKKFHGNGRMFFEILDKDRERAVNQPNKDYVEIDLENDWKMYSLIIQIDDPIANTLELKFGFWNNPNSYGKVAFMNPHLTIESDNYDGKLLMPQIIAQGIIGYDADNGWGAYGEQGEQRSTTHGIERISWNPTTKEMTVSYTHRLSEWGPNRPTPIFSLYTRGNRPLLGDGSRVKLPTSITPVLHSTGHHRSIYYFIDAENNTIDPEVLGATLYLTLVVFG
ncbi:hypothetical protein EH196_07110 [Bacillus sp. C1-1]|nr:hypothetical protein EH196_07110 [Bacillus sp. C1-1]